MQTVKDQLLTTGEVAKRLRVDTSTVRRWIRRGILEAVELPQIGQYRHYRVRRVVVARIIGAEAQEA